MRSVLAAAPFAQAADIAAGKAKAEAVCAACHGANGINVSDTIPNLAVQRAGYIEAQLKALKDGSRKSPVMNAMAAQLTPTEIADVAAFFASQPGAPAASKSAFLPNLAKTSVAFPATRQVRYYFANKTALQAAKSGKPVADGAYMLVEVHAAKLDAERSRLGQGHPRHA